MLPLAGVDLETFPAKWDIFPPAHPRFTLGLHFDLAASSGASYPAFSRWALNAQRDPPPPLHPIMPFLIGYPTIRNCRSRIGIKIALKIKSWIHRHVNLPAHASHANFFAPWLLRNGAKSLIFSLRVRQHTAPMLGIVVFDVSWRLSSCRVWSPFQRTMRPRSL